MSSTRLNLTQLNSTQTKSHTLRSTQINSTQLKSTHVNSTQINSTCLNLSQLNSYSTQLASSHLNSSQLNSTRARSISCEMNSLALRACPGLAPSTSCATCRSAAFSLAKAALNSASGVHFFQPPLPAGLACGRLQQQAAGGQWFWIARWRCWLWPEVSSCLFCASSVAAVDGVALCDARAFPIGPAGA